MIGVPEEPLSKKQKINPPGAVPQPNIPAYIAQARANPAHAQANMAQANLAQANQANIAQGLPNMAVANRHHHHRRRRHHRGGPVAPQ